ncbi:dipeptidyl aminopeptidase/acylaminoacyl peptidase [Actinoalloteichus hoggarensis]|uniref:S9 family peptidase n=1 Tax=Actinoalloteichus hoggarensis TaxID=1470176 RepID=UPI000B8B39CA|nr:prolyl oligopeptidase family serine peptidase [Actinoalloteichus hoggarensis]MBB5919010.1 dipeptidyl aminopeptidase/acylaminoacyl peptidase [Actinoalloteichus hoggarensis]
MVTISPYGTWTSPIDAIDAARSGGGVLAADLAFGQAWWTESRPEEGGRVALMRETDDGAPAEVLAAPWNVRNRVHEYGGRPWAAFETDGHRQLAFTHWDDQRVYLLDLTEPDAVPRPVSPIPDRPQGVRYGELVAGPGGREVWCVRETVVGDSRVDVRRDLVALPVSGEAGEDATAVRTLAASHHFLTAPRPSPDGRHAAWIGWEHPAMPWDGTELCVAKITEDGLAPHRVLAGGATEAVCQVRWADDESVYALTDPTGWWNPHRITLDGAVTPLLAAEVEIGGPLWQLGASWLAPLGDGRHAVLRGGGLALLDEAEGTVRDVETPLPSWRSTLACDGRTILGVASGPRSKPAVVAVDVATLTSRVLTGQPADLPDPAWLPVPATRTFTGPDGQRIPAHVYPPTNPDFAAPEGELPPFLVHVHGGPTGQNTVVLDPTIAYFTSRGIGVVAVDYGGSSGYGRAYRERLRESWGVVDVADCAAVAEALAAEGTADPRRLAVRGGSAGGWTTAASLTTVSVYRCGTAMYPILDLTGWSSGETHDFESRYLDSLVGPLPETARRYRDRSPVNNVDRLAGPILLLQGLEDEICPPEQCDRFVNALAGRGIPFAYLAFEGEQHGFRRAETIRTALEAELSFYAQVLEFEAPGVPTLALRR